MNRKTLALPLLLGLLLLAARAGAQDRSDWLFRWDARLWGADAALGWRGLTLFPGLDTVLWVSAGGGWQANNYFPPDDDSSAQAGADFKMLAADWRLGVSQGILDRPRGDGDLLQAVLLYRGRFQRYIDGGATLAGLPDETGVLQNSLLASLVLDSSVFDRARITKDGLFGSLTAEWAPGFFYNSVFGDSDYVRLTALLEGYRTLVSTPAISVYIADRLVYDRLLGDEARIPVSARTAIGGLTSVPISKNPLRGLGGSVRGIEGGRYDGFAKMVNNLDLRVHFPAWTLFRLLTPGLVAYVDTGIYDRGSGRLSFDPLLASVGAGVLLNALTYDFIVYGDYFLNERVFGVSLGLSAHF